MRDTLMRRRRMRSHVEGVASPPLQRGDPAAILNLMRLLDRTQWLPEHTLVSGQFRQLPVLADWLGAQSPSFAARMRTAGLRAGDLTDGTTLRRLPPLTRRAVQELGDGFACAAPPSHGAVAENRTSGSSGEPVRAMRTMTAHHYWVANTMRDHDWHERDFDGRAAIIRAGVRAASFPDWGQPVSLFFDSGPSWVSPIAVNVTDQAAWLQTIDPHYILTFPNNLSSLIDVLEREKTALPALRHIRTVGETVTPRLRQRARQVLGVDIVDQYSSEEAGVIALQCPVSGLYHLMAENLIVEIVGADGSACKPGEIGRVLLTDLHNFAMPLVRYDVGDYAEAGPPCPCGRGLPTLTRIVGRSRNMMMVDGDWRWPTIGFVHYDDVAPVRQYRYIQKTARLMHVHLVVAPALTPAQERALALLIDEALHTSFDYVFFCYPDRLPPASNGKMEEFICEIVPYENT